MNAKEIEMDYDDIIELAELIVNDYHVSAKRPIKALAKAHLDLLAKQEGMVPVEQVCPVCAGGPVIVLAECRDCATEFVSPEMSRYNKTAIAKAKE